MLAAPLTAVLLAGTGLHAPAVPPYRASVSPPSLVAGTTGATLTFRFAARARTSGLVALVVPTAWTRPQRTRAALPGYVRVTKGGCRSASISSIKGSAKGPWAVVVAVRCAKGKAFRLAYGAGTGKERVTVPKLAGPAAFRARARATGEKRYRDLATQPVFTVAAGPAVKLELTGLVDAAAGTAQAPTVTVRDAFGNPAAGYRGTVRFSGSGPQAAFPWDLAQRIPGWTRTDAWLGDADYTFTAADAGAHTFSDVKGIFAGAQTLTATDTATSTLTASRTVAIGPGPRHSVDVLEMATAGTVLRYLPINAKITFAAFDFFGNLDPTSNLTIEVAWGRGRPTDPDLEYIELPLVNGVATAHAGLYTTAVETYRFNVYDRIPGSPGITGRTISLDIVEPNLQNAALNAPNPPDETGRIVGTLDIPNMSMSLNPESIRLDGVPIILSNGSSTLALTATTAAGDEVEGKATATNFVDTVTGELVPSTGTVICGRRCAGTKIVVGGCLHYEDELATVLWQAPDQGVDLRIPPNVCRQVQSNFAPVWSEQIHEDTVALATEGSGINNVGIFTNLYDWQCRRGTWDYAQQRCFQVSR